MLPPFPSLSLSSLCVSSILPVVVEGQSSLSKDNINLNFFKTSFYNKNFIFIRKTNENIFFVLRHQWNIDTRIGSLAGTSLRWFAP
jgi:hypothetical protein